MASARKKIIDRWKLQAEGQSFEVDVRMIEHVGCKTHFRATCKPIEMRIENESIDALREEARKFVQSSAKAVWEQWIAYEVDFDPQKQQGGITNVGLTLSWRIVERTCIGTRHERYRDFEGASVRGHAFSGSPDVGYVSSWRGSTDKTKFAGLIAFSPGAVAGLEAIARGIESLYAALGSYLLPQANKDPARWLETIASSGPPMLPAPGERSERAA